MAFDTTCAECGRDYSSHELPCLPLKPATIRVTYDKSITHCPICYKDGAAVRLASARIAGKTSPEKFCPYHGQITGRDFMEVIEPNRRDIPNGLN